MSADDLRVTRRLTIPAAELDVSTAHAGGPGGQNVNKVETKVVLRWSVAESTALDEAQRRRLLEKLASRLTREGELVVHAGRRRSQEQNREDARERLASLVREALAVPKKRRATRPTAGSRRRRLERKKQRGALKRERRRGPYDD